MVRSVCSSPPQRSLRQGSGLLFLLLASCVSPTPPGLGTLGPGAQARLSGLPSTASAAAVQRACDAARAPGASERAQRKAVDMALGWIGSYPQSPERGAIMSWVTPIATSLSSGPNACQAAGEVGRLFLAGGDPNRAGDLFVRAAKECGNIEAAVLAVAPLAQVNRCGEAIEAIQGVWPRAQQSEWSALLDGVAQCSTELSLRQNLSFVPEAVRMSYLEERERERQAADQAARDAAEASRRAQAQSYCLSDCSSSANSCRNSCNGHSPCYQRCDSLGSACRSGCYR